MILTLKRIYINRLTLLRFFLSSKALTFHLKSCDKSYKLMLMKKSTKEGANYVGASQLAGITPHLANAPE